MAVLLALPVHVVQAENDAVIRSGCSGGFTGGGSGYEIHRDGSISSWRTDSWKASPDTTVIRNDKAAVGRLFSPFEEAGFSRINLNEPGNMTCFLTLESEGKNHTVSWSQKPLQPVQELYDAVVSIVTGKPDQGGMAIIETVPPPPSKLKPVEKQPAPMGGR